jgi:hypothetical protein
MGMCTRCSASIFRLFLTSIFLLFNQDFAVSPLDFAEVRRGGFDRIEELGYLLQSARRRRRSIFLQHSRGRVVARPGRGSLGNRSRFRRRPPERRERVLVPVCPGGEAVCVLMRRGARAAEHPLVAREGTTRRRVPSSGRFGAHGAAPPEPPRPAPRVGCLPAGAATTGDAPPRSWGAVHGGGPPRFPKFVLRRFHQPGPNSYQKQAQTCRTCRPYCSIRDDRIESKAAK